MSAFVAHYIYQSYSTYLNRKINLPIDGLNEPWWNDFICVWKRVEEKETNIIVEESISNKIGPLCRQLINRGLKITNKIQA